MMAKHVLDVTAIPFDRGQESRTAVGAVFAGNFPQGNLPCALVFSPRQLSWSA
jgi:hypothetical protein